ncbi:MAG: hypothetical protein HWE10_12090 [Gammaproteobacteria bacterium]|nr:hypothetical protein [Gammaproteobacteria bacterium]
MTKPHQEQLLQELMAKSKQQSALPNDVKSKILRHAKNSQFPLAFMLRWQTICAAVLIGWLWFDASRSNLPTYSVTKSYSDNNQLVYYHQVKYLSTPKVELAKTDVESLNLTEDPEYFSYLASIDKVKNGNRLTGIVKKSEQEVVIEICQVGLIKLAPSVIQALDSPAIINNLKVGQNITLLADNRGKLFGIEPNRNSANNLNQCAS